VSEKQRKKQAKRAARREVARRKQAARLPRDAQGRAHLIVHRDLQSGGERLSLARPLFNEAWQNEVALGAAGTAHALLSEGHTVDQAVKLGRSAMAGTSKIAEGLLASSADQPPACRAGCAHCCYQAVGITTPEALAIYDHLRATRSPSAFEAIARRIRAADDDTRGMTSAERLSPNLPCPFLEEERCSIYEARPLSCRGANSLDAAACERALRDPDARAAFLAGDLSFPCYLEPIRAFHAVTAGMQIAVHELHGLQMLPLELTAAMRILLDDPETLPQRWLAGEDAFEDARGGDVTTDARIRALAGTTTDGV
jgi:hypothetical protein